MSSKQTKAAIDLATLDAIERASHFTASLRVRNGQQTHELKTLAQAREAAKLMPEAYGALTRALVYAVTPEGRAYLVAEDFPDPATPEGREASMNLVAMADKIGTATHKATNGVTLAGPKPTPAPEAGKAAKVTDLGDGIPKFLERSANEPGQKTAKQAAEEARKAPSIAAPRAIPSNPGKPTAKSATAPATAAKTAQSTPTSTKPKAEAPKADSSKETSVISTKASKNKARAAVKPAAKTTAKKPAAGERTRYDWSGAEEAAAKGKLPPAPDFSAATHERFRPLLAEVVKAAKAGKADDLKKIKVNPVSSSPKAIDRYRKLCLKALSAQKAA